MNNSALVNSKNFLALLLIIFTFSLAAQTTFIVTNSNDVGAGSLRQAILDANASTSADTIDMTQISGTILLNSALPKVTRSVTINGPGEDLLSISGQNLHRPFFINSGTVNLNNFTIINGLAKGGDGRLGRYGGGGGAGMGGALITNVNVNLTLEHLTFDGNTAQGGKGGGCFTCNEHNNLPYFNQGFYTDRFGYGGAGAFSGITNAVGLDGAFGSGGASGQYVSYPTDVINAGNGGYGAGGGGGSVSPVDVNYSGNTTYGTRGLGGKHGGDSAPLEQDLVNSLMTGLGGGGAGLGGAVFFRGSHLVARNLTFANNTALRGGSYDQTVPIFVEGEAGDGSGKGAGLFVYADLLSVPSIVPTYVFDGIVYLSNTSDDGQNLNTDNQNLYLEDGLSYLDNTLLDISRSFPKEGRSLNENGTIKVWFNEIPYTNSSQAPLTNSDIASKITLREKALQTPIAFNSTIENNLVQITPSDPLLINEEYEVIFNDIYDSDGTLGIISTLTFTSDFEAPVFTLNGVFDDSILSREIIIQSDEAFFNLDQSFIENVDLPSLITLTENDAGGSAVPFTASISNQSITLSIDQPLADQTYHLVINNVQDLSGNQITVSQEFTLVSPAGISLSPDPADGSTIGKRLFGIHSNEPLFNTDNTPLTDVDLSAKLMLKENDMNGADVPFDAFLEGNSIYIASNSLVPSMTYWVSIQDVEDVTGIELAQTTFTFSTSNLFNPVAGSGFALNFVDGEVITDNILLAGDFTIEAWVNTSASDGLIAGNEMAVGLIEFGIAAGKLSLGDGTTTISSIASIDDGMWHHVAASLSGSSAQLYIDGVADGSGTITATTRTVNRLANGYQGGVTTTYTGSLDEVRIWNSAVSGTNISTNRLAALNGSHPDIANLAAYFSVDESVGPFTHDYNGNLVQGVISGDFSWEVSAVNFPAPDLEITVDAVPIAFEESYGFGSLALSTTSAVKTFQIENTGTEDLLLRGSPVISLAGPSASEFTLDQTGISTVLAPAATTTFTVSFTPTTAGFREAEIVIENGSINDPYRIRLEGVGLDITTNGDWDFVGGSPGVLSLMSSAAAHNGEFYAAYNKIGTGIQLARLVGDEFQDIGAFNSFGANMEISPGGRIFTFSTDDINTATSVRETSTSAGSTTNYSNSSFSINNASAFDDRTRFAIAFDATKAYGAYSYADDGNVLSMHGIKIDELVSGGTTSNLATLTRADLVNSGNTNWNIFAYDIAFDSNDDLWVAARTRISTQAELFLAKYDGSWTVYDLSATPGLAAATHYVGIAFDSNDDIHIANMGGGNIVHYIKANTTGTVLTSDVVNTFTTYSSQIQETGGSSPVPMTSFALGTDDKPIFVYVDADTDRPKALKYDNAMFNEFSDEFVVADQVNTGASDPFNFSIDPVSGRGFLAYTTTTASSLTGALQSVVSTKPIVPEIAVLIDDTEVVSGAEFLLQAGVGFEKSITLKIENTGVSGIQLTGDPIIDFTGTNIGALSYDLDGLATTLAPDAFIEIPISFNPQAPFDEIISVSIPDNTPSGETTFNLQLSGLDNSNTNNWEEYSNVNSAILNSVDMTIKNGKPRWAHNNWVLLNAVNNPNTGMLENFEYAELHLHDIYEAGNTTPISTIAAYQNDPTVAGNWALQAEQLDYFQKIRFVQNEKDESTILLNARPYTADPMGTPYEDFTGNTVIQSGDGFNLYQASTSLGYHDMIVDEAGDIFSTNLDFDASDSFYDLVVIKGTQAINTNVAQITNTIANGDNDIDMEMSGNDLYIAYADGTTLNVINFLKTDVVNTSPTNILAQTDARTLGSSDSRTKDLELSESGQLYLAYIENSTNEVRVKSYDGTGSNWTDLPSINFGAYVGTPDPVDLQLQIHPDGTPFVSAVLDLGNGQQGFAIVHRYINGAWELVGNTFSFSYPGFTFDGNFFNVAFNVQKAILQITDDGKPYLMAGNKVYTTNLTPDDFDQVPEFTSTPVVTVDEEVAYTYNVVTDDADDADALTISATDVPAWLTFSDNGDRTATLSGTPTDEDADNYTITLTVSDGIISVDQVVNLEVTNVDDDPDFFIESTIYMDESQLARSIDITGITDGDASLDQTLTFSVTSDNTALVSDQTVNYTAGSETATLDFTHAANMHGVANLTVRLEDDGLQFKEMVVTVNVIEGDVILLSSDPSGTLIIDENVAIGTDVATILVSDIDLDETYTFSLVSGTGDTNNSLFTIVDSTLQTTAALDFELISTPSLRIQGDNGAGGVYERVFAISVQNVNEAATDFTLSSTDFDEGVLVGTVIGTFSATDPDATNTHVYTLNGSFGNNDAFQIVGNELQIAQVTDFDTFSGPFSIQVELDDSGEILLRDFSITLNNINVAPTDITLTNETISEEFGVGSIVGNLLVTDTDGDDSHTFTFTDDAISNADFEIDGVQLKTTRTFDFETETSVDVEVKVTDAGLNTYNELFTLTITDANDGPTAIDLTSTSVDENVAIGTVVGTISTTDQDAGDTHTYEIASTFNFDIDGVVRSPLAISGSDLVTDVELDHEDLASFLIRIISTDAAGGQTLADYTIDVNNLNEVPTDIALTNSDIDEDAAVGTVIGVLSTTDPDASETHTYEVLTAFDDGGMTFFPIITDEANLITTVPLDFESLPSFNVEVQVTDAGGLTYTEFFTLSANDVNEAPTSMTLSANTIAENTAAGVRVGLLIGTDQDLNDPLTYSLVAGTGDEGNAFFQMGGAGGNEIENAAILDFETQATYSVRARVTDAAGLFYEEAFTIEVTDNNDGPTGIELSASTIAEHSEAGTTIGSFTAIDQDANDTHTFTFHPNYPDNTFFAIDGADLNVASDINFESTPTLTIGVFVFDADGGNSFEQEFIIEVTDVDEGQDQVITFETLPTQTFGDAPFELTGTATSNLALDYSSSNEAVATISGSTVSIVGVGETTISANQAGNAVFNPATAVSQILVVEKAAQTITFSALSDMEIGAAPIALSATASSGLTVDYVVSGSATISGSTLTITDVGEVSVTASQTGDDNYLEAASVTHTFLVTDPAKTDQTITFEALDNRTFGDAAFDLSGSASSGLALSYSSSDETVATISGSTVTIVGGGETVITASQNGDDSFNPAVSVSQTLTVEKADQFLTFEVSDKVTTDDPFDISATSDSGLPVTIAVTAGPATISGNTVTLTGEAGIVELAFSQVGNNNYNAASAISGFTVTDETKQDQVITFDLPNVAYISDGSIALVASSDSGLDIAFEIVEGAEFASINNDVLEFIAPGLVVIAAGQAGNDDFNPALSGREIEIRPVFTLTGNVTAQGSTFNGGALVAIGGVTDETYTVEISGEGDYTLENLKEGDYYVGVDPNNTIDYHSTYYGNGIFWEDAIVITVFDQDLPGYDIEVEAKGGDDLLVGDGVIMGRIIEDDGEGGRVELGRILEGTAIPDVPVFLIRISDEQIMTVVKSDANGDFEITGIPEGEYRLKVEIAGATMDLAGSTISIDAEGTPVVLTAMVGEDGISLNVAPPALGIEDQLQLTVYPNPSTDHINVEMESESSVRVYDLNGQTLLRKDFKGNIRLNVGDFEEGIYFLEVSSERKSVIEKFVKVN